MLTLQPPFLFLLEIVGYKLLAINIFEDFRAGKRLKSPDLSDKNHTHTIAQIRSRQATYLGFNLNKGQQQHSSCLNISQIYTIFVLDFFL